MGLTWTIASPVRPLLTLSKNDDLKPSLKGSIDLLVQVIKLREHDEATEKALATLLQLSFLSQHQDSMKKVEGLKEVLKEVPFEVKVRVDA